MYRTTRVLKGFTLIELLVVIAIIGILATIVTASVGQGQAKARDSRRIADVRNVQLALEMYYNDYLKYPNKLGDLVPNYLSVLPKDPRESAACTDGTQASCYFYDPVIAGSSHNCTAYSNTGYHLGANLEVTTNSALTEDVDWANSNGAAVAGHLSCNNASNNTGGNDFNGHTTTCGGSDTASDGCYDVGN